jgi:hypothetical protein
VCADTWTTIAAVVRGVPPALLGNRLQDVQDRFRLTHQSALDDFRGETTAFADANDDLLPLLATERRPPSRRGRIVLTVAALLLTILAFGLAAGAIARQDANRHLAKAYADALASEPGIVVTSQAWKGGQHGAGYFTGLRDPLAARPRDIFARAGLAPLPPSNVALAPFVSSDPRLTKARIERLLEPPPGITLLVDGPVLRVVGTAPRAWIDRAHLLVRTVSAIEQLDDRELRSNESLDAVREVAALLEAQGVPFRRGDARLDPSNQQELARLSAASLLALEVARQARLDACIEIRGYSDATGAEVQNRELRAARASTIADALASAGVPRAVLRPRAGVPSPTSRREVTFRLDLDCQGPR